MKNTFSIIDTVCCLILFSVMPPLLFPWKKYLLIGSLLFVSVAANAGIIIKTKKLEVRKENYSFYLFNQKPDRAVAFLLEYADDNAGANRQKLDNELKKNNILFFRCYYSNADSTVYKYIDISVKGVPIKEVALIDPQLQTIEVQQFYQNGALLSRTQYSINAKRVEGDTKRYDTAWHQDNPNLTKNGRQEMYHKNGTVRFGRA